jgi:hypothetical protein
MRLHAEQERKMRRKENNDENEKEMTAGLRNTKDSCEQQGTESSK